ncbi:glycoside hydrolase [Haematococcus lacustris]|uniref:Glycoside hydrolase n=1 Tax=Haematococcus lacustris TaxID=44745 RepID=A0A699Y892_HAELA|nr:glycoside hydrolase [Haematococcus lacustris]
MRDPDHVLSTNGANVVEGVIKLIASGEAPYVQQPCGPDRRLTGFEVAFALMDKFYSGWGADLGRTAQKFAASLHDTWGVGDPACQNGVLVLLTLCSSSRGACCRFDEAMQHVAVNIGLALAGHKIEPDRGSDTMVYIVVPLFVIAFVAIAWKSRQDERSTRTRHQRCNSLLERIKRDQDSLNSGAAFAVTSCPICLEEFAVGPPPSAPPMPAEVAAEHTAAYSDSPSAPLLGEVQPPDAGLARRRSPSSSTIYPTVPPATASFGPGEHSVSPPASVPTTGLADGQAGGSSVAGQAAERGRTPLVAPCGHMFCEPCLASWVLEQRKTSCPICRQNMEGDGAAPGPPPPPRRPCTEQQEDWCVAAWLQG